MKRAAAVLMVVGLAGCGRKPEIANCHWSGSSLYDKTGSEVASFIGTLPGTPSQICVFRGYETCHYLETDEEALATLTATMKAHPEYCPVRP